MYNFLSRNGQIIGFVLGALLTVVFLAIVFSSAETFSTLSEKEQMQSSIFDFGLTSAIVLTILCGIAAILFGLFYMVTHFKSSLKAIIGIAVLALIFIIGYSMADPDGSGSLANTILEFGVTDSSSKFISGAMTTTGILGAIAIAGLVLFELYNLIK